MFDDLTTVLIVFAGVFMIVALRYMRLKATTAGQMSAQEITAYEQMAERAQHLEKRLVTLERILDVEQPAWRNGSDFYERASRER